MLDRHLYISTFRRIRKVLTRTQKRRCAAVVLVTLLNGIVDVLGLACVLPLIYLAADPTKVTEQPWLNKAYTSIGFESPDVFLIGLAIFVLGAFVAKNLMAVFFLRVQSRFSFGLAVELIERQFRNFLKRDYLYFKGTNSNEVMRDVATIPTDFAKCVLLPMLLATNEGIVIALIILGIGVYNPMLLVMLALVLGPCTLFAFRFGRRRIHELGQATNKLRPVTFKNIFEPIHGYVDVKLANKESYFVGRSHRGLRKLYDMFARLTVFQGVPQRIIEVGAIAAITGVTVFAMVAAQHGREAILTTLAVFAIAAYRVMPSLNRIAGYMVQVRRGQYVFDALMDAQPDSEDAGPGDRLQFEKSLTLQDVTLRYPNSTVNAINGITLNIRRGEVVGIVGESGSGKSTLVKIILGLLKPAEGELLVDGKLVTQGQRAAWHNFLGYVEQDFYLLDATLAENVAFGEPFEEIDFGRLENSLRMAHLHHFVATLPEGIKTNVGEFGGKLSGGQRQRIAIARAIYKQAKILVFDEATSALDSATEQNVIHTLREIADAGVTMLIIAHRVTTLKYCDRIIEIANGEVVRAISFEELMSEFHPHQSIKPTPVLNQ